MQFILIKLMVIGLLGRIFMLISQQINHSNALVVTLMAMYLQQINNCATFVQSRLHGELACQ